MLGRLLVRHAGEESQLHHLRRLGVGLLQMIERFVQGDQLWPATRIEQIDGIHVNSPGLAAPFGRGQFAGMFDEPISEGSWLHNLEHGGIVLLFKCEDDCDARVNQTRDLFDELPDGNFGEVKLVATPYERAPTEFTLLAWGWQEDLDEFDTGRIERFYRDLVDRGPEAAP